MYLKSNNLLTNTLSTFDFYILTIQWQQPATNKLLYFTPKIRLFFLKNR